MSTTPRIQVVRWILGFCFTLLLSRLVFLHLRPIGADDLRRLAEKQYQQDAPLSLTRGGIFDRRGRPVAISVMETSVGINPRLFAFTAGNVERLAGALGVGTEAISRWSDTRGYFRWIARRVPDPQVARAKALEMPGVHFRLEPSRYYPLGAAAGSLVGYVGHDQVGLLGIEYHVDQRLAGTTTRGVVLRDATGQAIMLDPDDVQGSGLGHRVNLTLDANIQTLVYDAMVRVYQESAAQRAYAMVLDPYTGHILAAVSLPSFDPERPETLNLLNQTPYALTQRFEPGSTVKPFVYALALQDRMVHPDEPMPLATQSRRYEVAARRFIHDEHPRPHLTARGVITYSSNIGTFLLATRLGKQRLAQGMRAFGLGGSGDQAPGALFASGRLHDPNQWSEHEFATISFGQGFLTTLSELVQGYAVFANGGRRIRPTLIDSIETENGVAESGRDGWGEEEAVLDPAVAGEVRRTLADVIRLGTGRNARSKEYSIGGKTGTAEVFDLASKTYHRERRVASFLAIAPATSQPHIVVGVVVDEPRVTPYYGGKWAAPVAREIAEKTLRYMGVAPDLI